MNGIILAAGIGKRLAPFTDNFPKGMIKLFDKSLIEMQIDVFHSCGINDITIVTGYLSEKMTFHSVQYIKNENFSSTNMNESLFCAKEKLCDSVLISYSDIIFEKKILDQLQNFKGDIGVAVRLNWKSSYNGRTLHSKIEAENILLENGKILKTQKNISEELPNQTVAEFLGLIKLSKVGCSIFLEKFSELKKSHTGKFHSSPSLKQAYLTDMLQELIDTGYTVEPVLVNGNWCEIDTIQDIENARKNFRL
tara:strand:- start:1156 stop:1908 length:753 start_codon:yes stop_codon:yes gene_type:complete